MSVKVYISGISGNKEVKKRQQRVLMILDSKNVQYEIIDITEPGKEYSKEYMQSFAKSKDSKHPLPPQIFNEDAYCGDYEGFDSANEVDNLEKFLKLTSIDDDIDDIEENNTSSNNTTHNRKSSSRGNSMENDASSVHSESNKNERENSIADDRDSENVKSSDIDALNKSKDMDQTDISEKKSEKSDEDEQEE